MMCKRAPHLGKYSHRLKDTHFVFHECTREKTFCFLHDIIFGEV